MLKEKILAIIPARGGSKRLPDKNIKKMHGFPLIEWTIQAAIDSKVFEHVIVSTDSEKIAEIAKNAGADVPFLRPADLSGDEAKSNDVILHAINFLEENHLHFDSIALLQPTSPLRTAKHIQEAFKLKQLKQADAVISVCPCEHSPLWANSLPDDLSMDLFLNESIINKRSQDLPVHYRLNGAIYIIKKDLFLESKSFFSTKNSFAYIMDTKSSIDIDEELDFIMAETILSKCND
ncbi:acylneuraminate cytidylyltransferase family protein [Photobacterium galatheae]|uniref:acylneuraminate cytidylyltransferase family protein n=1 Tax=Photobacterium galatheae TaxID=1654360 RepID=UPI00202CAFF3|nr:acylneuraminate cytidylyltransferase family protein [Photobacterium galatheae]MCM0147570.1 acylneuraminate cytidylyltransferase family protein [Photobacterium galatheae]